MINSSPGGEKKVCSLLSCCLRSLDKQLGHSVNSVLETKMMSFSLKSSQAVSRESWKTPKARGQFGDYVALSLIL